MHHIAIGMVLGAYKGVEAIPPEWKETFDQWTYCENLLEKLPAQESNKHRSGLSLLRRSRKRAATNKRRRHSSAQGQWRFTTQRLPDLPACIIRRVEFAY